jgi:hypothetical protein
MNFAEQIIENMEALSEQRQIEVLDFAEYLRARAGKQRQKKNWTDFSLTSAMRGMEDETSVYSLNDLEETFS